MPNSTQESATTGRCRWCLDRDRHIAEAETRVDSGLSHLHPLVTRALSRARIAGLRSGHPIVIGGRCPHETEVTP
jgi:hypothetical protein